MIEWKKNGEITEFDMYGKGNIFIMKIDNMGELLFTTVWSDYTEFVGEGIAISDNDEIYLSGYDNNWNSRGMILLKLNKNGEEIWEKY